MFNTDTFEYIKALIDKIELLNGVYKEAPMNVEFINPFVNAAMNVLETMAFVKPKAGKPYLRKVMM